MDTIPLHAYDLIDDLNQMFPEKSYDLKKSLEENIHYSGVRSVVNTLVERKKLEEQQEKERKEYTNTL